MAKILFLFAQNTLKCSQIKYPKESPWTTQIEEGQQSSHACPSLYSYFQHFGQEH